MQSNFAARPKLVCEPFYKRIVETNEKAFYLCDLIFTYLEINNKRVWKIINKKFRYKIFPYYHRCSTLADNIPLIFSQQWCLQHFTKTFCWSDVLFSFDSEYLNNSALQHAFHVLQLIAFWICIFHDKDVSVWGAKPFELEQIILLNGPVSQCCAYAKFSNNLRFMT